MKCALLALALIPACSGYVRTSWRDLHENPHYSFADYVEEYGKKYADAAEYAAKKATFEANVAKIRAHNSEGHSWKMGLNHLTDVDTEDKKAMRAHTGKIRYNTFKLPGASHATVDELHGPIPDSIDWRTKGAVTPVKNQGGCGSCWAFSSTESLESHLFLDAGKLIEMAPQQLVSCVPNPDDCGGTGGCGGATEELAFAYAVSNGTSDESSYPYKGQTLKCDKKEIDDVAGFKGYKKLPTNDEGSLLQAVATKGPISISVDASFGPYESGVFTAKGACWTIDHAVQAVGYGTDPEGGDYWIVRNSWGAQWGEQGYIRMKRFGAGEAPCGVDQSPGSGSGCKGAKPMQVCGTCGMLSDSSYPWGGYLTKEVPDRRPGWQ